jgi:acetyl-CoA carboxylase carboxyltransferase component
VFSHTNQSEQHAVAQIRRHQSLVRTPNLSNPGYIRQKQAGKLWVRERLNALLDAGSFDEVGSLTGRPDEEGGIIPAYTTFTSAVDLDEETDCLWVSGTR